jgi:uncharacterized damage-inducible protein DinB
MFRMIADFSAEWKYEMEATLNVMDRLTDASLTRKVTPDGRSLGFLAWHIAGSIGEMLKRAGLANDGVSDDDDLPASARKIAEVYKQIAETALKQIVSHWTDEQLLEEIPMYDESWKRGFILSVLIRHQAHHRAQMTVLMRQAGLTVPGVYGPAKEEWQKMNLPPMK